MSLDSVGPVGGNTENLKIIEGYFGAAEEEDDFGNIAETVSNLPAVELFRIGLVIKENPYPIPSDTEETLRTESNIKKNWRERTNKKLDKLIRIIDENIEQNKLQKVLNAVGAEIEKTITGTQFSKWLNATGQGDWYEKLSSFLVKLPFRAVRNVLWIVYSVVKAAAYSFIHPLKAPIYATKLLINFADLLTQPKTWSSLGAGLIGGSLGSLVVSGNPFALIGFMVGGMMIALGLIGGALRAGVGAEKGKRMEEVKREVKEQVKKMPEVFLTGFLIGALTTGITEAAAGGHVGGHEKSLLQPKAEAEQLHHVGTEAASEAGREIFPKGGDQL